MLPASIVVGAILGALFVVAVAVGHLLYWLQSFYPPVHPPLSRADQRGPLERPSEASDGRETQAESFANEVLP